MLIHLHVTRVTTYLLSGMSHLWSLLLAPTFSETGGYIEAELDHRDFDPTSDGCDIEIKIDESMRIIAISQLLSNFEKFMVKPLWTIWLLYGIELVLYYSS